MQLPNFIYKEKTTRYSLDIIILKSNYSTLRLVAQIHFQKNRFLKIAFTKNYTVNFIGNPDFCKLIIHPNLSCHIYQPPTDTKTCNTAAAETVAYCFRPSPLVCGKTLARRKMKIIVRKYYTPLLTMASPILI